jgi:carboxyl-terminal processing protease
VYLSSARQAAAALLGLALAQPTAAAERPMAGYVHFAASDFATVAHASGRVITDDTRRHRADRIARFSAPFTLILQRVRQHYFEEPNEQKMLSAAIDAMSRISPAVRKVSDRGGALSLETVYEAAQEAFNERGTADDDARLLRAAIDGMLSTLDRDSSYLDPKGFHDLQAQTRGPFGFGGLGIEVAMKDGLVKVAVAIEGAPAARAGVRGGDIITELDDVPVRGLTLDQTVEKMRGTVNTKIRLKVIREGADEPIELSVTRQAIRMRSMSSRVDGEDVGYIRLALFNERTTDDLKQAIDNLTVQVPPNVLKGYVLDLRSTPGGLLDQAVSVADAFLEHGEIVSTRGRGTGATQRFSAKPGDLIHGRPIVVLIDGKTAAGSVVVAAALQDNKRATIVGTPSLGKGSVQSIIPLGSAYGALRLTTARFFRPADQSIGGKGMLPDIAVSPEAPDEPTTKSPPVADATSPVQFPREGEERRGLQSGLPPTRNHDKVLQVALDLLRSNAPH